MSDCESAHADVFQRGVVVQAVVGTFTLVQHGLTIDQRTLVHALFLGVLRLQAG
ncbi:hypothetical protein [Desulfonatronum sp. SC1]|uniref:hypothetical protein n=1 Tax=Desulfonatronum sp. SC1 TaxID=2109626 RepID=UPI001305022D|nr:hypothetical protein [Desulfonatronum sp. SC1]